METQHAHNIPRILGLGDSAIEKESVEFYVCHISSLTAAIIKLIVCYVMKVGYGENAF